MIPASVEFIGEKCFDCPMLREIEYQGHVASIARNAFGPL
jgi:hypothetical protein